MTSSALLSNGVLVAKRMVVRNVAAGAIALTACAAVSDTAA